MKAQFFLMLCVAVIFGGCTRTIYMPVETRIETRTEVADTTTIAEVHNLVEQLKNNSVMREKVIVRDSVVIVQNERGEVIMKESFKNSDREYSERELIERITFKYDSIFNSQRILIDSLSNRLSEVSVPVEKSLSKWQKLKMDFGAIALGVFFTVFIFLVIWIVKKYRKWNPKFGFFK